VRRSERGQAAILLVLMAALVLALLPVLLVQQGQAASPLTNEVNALLAARDAAESGLSLFAAAEAQEGVATWAYFPTPSSAIQSRSACETGTSGGDWVTLTSGPGSFTLAPVEQVAVGTTTSNGGLTTWVFAEGRAGLAGHWACAELAARWTFGLTGASRTVVPVAVGTTEVPG